MIDEIDRRILMILQRNARTSNADIARAVAMAPSAVLERVRKLERKGVISGYEARIDPAGMLRFFETLEKAEAGAPAAKVPAVLSTHPATKERIAWLREATATAGGSSGAAASPARCRR